MAIKSDFRCMYSTSSGSAMAQTVASLSPQKPRSDPMPLNVGVMVDQTAMGQVCLQVFQFPSVSIIPPKVCINVIHLPLLPNLTNSLHAAELFLRS